MRSLIMSLNNVGNKLNTHATVSYLTNIWRKNKSQHNTSRFQQLNYKRLLSITLLCLYTRKHTEAREILGIETFALSILTLPPKNGYCFFTLNRNRNSKMSPCTISLSSYICLVIWDHWLYVVYIWTNRFCLCTGVVEL